MLRIFAVSMALALATGGDAWACQGKTTAAILDDTFKSPDPGWGAPDDAASFTPGGLVLKPPVNGSAWRWNPNYTLDGNDLCVSVVNPSQPSGRPATGDVGVWFWSQSAQNFYTATLSLDGTASIDRLVSPGRLRRKRQHRRNLGVSARPAVLRPIRPQQRPVKAFPERQ